MQPPNQSDFNNFVNMTNMQSYTQAELEKMMRDRIRDPRTNPDGSGEPLGPSWNMAQVREEREDASIFDYEDHFDLRPVKGEPGLYKDMRTGAVINVDKTSYQMYMTNKKKLDYQRQKQEITNQRVEKIDSDLSDVKTELSELKGLIKDLITTLNT